jgi:hypothetical protein
MVLVLSGGPFGTVPELLFDKKRLIPALQQILSSNGKSDLSLSGSIEVIT